MRRLFLAALLLASCGGKRSAARADAGLPEQWDEATRTYRAAGGAAVLTLPPLGPEWTVVRERRGEAALLTVFLGTRDRWRGYVSFLFFPPATQVVEPAAVVAACVRELRASASWLAPVGAGEEFLLPGGRGHAVQLAGRDPRGVTEVLNVIAVADGNAAVGVIFRGTPAEMKGGRLEEIATPLLGGLRVGRAARASAHGQTGPTTQIE